MGAPASGQLLTPMEDKAVTAYVTEFHGENKSGALARAGYSDPVANACKVFARPRVQNAIKQYFPETHFEKCAKRLHGALDAEFFINGKDRPDWGNRLRAIELTAKLTGELTERTAPSEINTQNVIIFQGSTGTLPRSAGTPSSSSNQT